MYAAARHAQRAQRSRRAATVPDETAPAPTASSCSEPCGSETGRFRMELLWSLAVATGGNQWQMATPRRPVKQAKTVAVGCVQLPESFHGKEGSTVRVRQRALQHPAKRDFFSRFHLHNPQRAVGMEPFMEPSGRGRRLQKAVFPAIAPQHAPARRNCYLPDKRAHDRQSARTPKPLRIGAPIAPADPLAERGGGRSP